MLHGHHRLAGDLHFSHAFQRSYDPTVLIRKFHSTPLSRTLRREFDYASRTGNAAFRSVTSKRPRNSTITPRWTPQAIVTASIQPSRGFSIQPPSHADGGGLLRGSGSGKTNWASSTPTYADVQVQARIDAKKRAVEAALAKKLAEQQKELRNKKVRAHVDNILAKGYDSEKTFQAASGAPSEIRESVQEAVLDALEAREKAIAAQEAKEAHQKRLQEARQIVAGIVSKRYTWEQAIQAASQAPSELRGLVYGEVSREWENRYKKEVKEPIDRIEADLNEIQRDLQEEKLLTTQDIDLVLWHSHRDAIATLLERSAETLERFEKQYNVIDETVHHWWSNHVKVAKIYEEEFDDLKSEKGKHHIFNNLVSDYCNAKRDVSLATNDFTNEIRRRFSPALKHKPIDPYLEPQLTSFRATSKQRRAYIAWLHLIAGWQLGEIEVGQMAHTARALDTAAIAAERIPHVLKCQLAGYRYTAAFEKVKHTAKQMVSLFNGYRSFRERMWDIGIEKDHQRSRLFEIKRQLEVHEDSMRSHATDLFLAYRKGFHPAAIKERNPWDDAQIRRYRPLTTNFYGELLQALRSTHDVLDAQLKISAGMYDYGNFREDLNIFDKLIVQYNKGERRFLEALTVAQLWTGVADVVLGLKTVKQPVNSKADLISSDTTLSTPTTTALTEVKPNIEFINSSVGMFYACQDLARSELLGVEVIPSAWHRSLGPEFWVITNGHKVTIFELNRADWFHKMDGRANGQLEPALSTILNSKKIVKVTSDAERVRQHLLRGFSCDLENVISIDDLEGSDAGRSYKSNAPNSVPSLHQDKDAPLTALPSYVEIANLLKRPRVELIQVFEDVARHVLANLKRYRASRNYKAPSVQPSNSDSKEFHKDPTQDSSNSPIQFSLTMGPIEIDNFFEVGDVRQADKSWRMNIQWKKREDLLHKLSASWAESVLKGQKYFGISRFGRDQPFLRHPKRALQTYCLIVKFNETLRDIDGVLQGNIPTYDSFMKVIKKAGLSVDYPRLTTYSQLGDWPDWRATSSLVEPRRLQLDRSVQFEERLATSDGSEDLNLQDIGTFESFSSFRQKIRAEAARREEERGVKASTKMTEAAKPTKISYLQKAAEVLLTSIPSWKLDSTFAKPKLVPDATGQAKEAATSSVQEKTTANGLSWVPLEVKRTADGRSFSPIPSEEPLSRSENGRVRAVPSSRTTKAASREERLRMTGSASVLDAKRGRAVASVRSRKHETTRVKKTGLESNLRRVATTTKTPLGHNAASPSKKLSFEDRMESWKRTEQRLMQKIIVAEQAKAVGIQIEGSVKTWKTRLQTVRKLMRDAAAEVAAGGIPILGGVTRVRREWQRRRNEAAEAAAAAGGVDVNNKGNQRDGTTKGAS